MSLRRRRRGRAGEAGCHYKKDDTAPEGEVIDAEYTESTEDGEKYSIPWMARARWINTLIAAEKKGFNEDAFYRVMDKTFDVLKMLHDNGFQVIPDGSRPLEIQGSTIIKALQGNIKFQLNSS